MRGIVVRLSIFMVICVLVSFALLTVFAEFRFGGGKTYNAVFSNVSGLKKGNLVRVAGVEVGKVQDIVINRDSTVRVSFTAQPSAVLTEGTRAVIRYDDLIGGRYLGLEEETPDAKVIHPGQTIPKERTQPALDLESVMGGLRPLVQSLKSEDINALTNALTSALEGQGPTIGSFLAQASAVTNTLADRDLLIGQVVDNLNVVMGSLGGQSDQLDKAVTSLSGLVHELAGRKTEIANAVASTNAATGAVSDLLAQSRESIQKAVHETDRVAGTLLLDHDNLDNLLNTLTDKYRALNRQAIYGGFFSFYFCDVLIKVNGKGGQPLYVKLAGQSTGRCAPK